jgi:hypothetical protein
LISVRKVPVLFSAIPASEAAFPKFVKHLLFSVSVEVLSAHSGGRNMNDWQSTYLGRGTRDLSGFEMQPFLTYSESERRVIDDERRTWALKLALALQIGFLRMTGVCW